MTEPDPNRYVIETFSWLHGKGRRGWQQVGFALTRDVAEQAAMKVFAPNQAVRIKIGDVEVFHLGLEGAA